MASATQTAKSQQQYREKGWFGKAIVLPLALLGILLISLFSSIVTEWIGFLLAERRMAPLAGHSEQRDGVAIQVVHPEPLIKAPDHTARWIVGFVYEWCFEKTGLVDWIKLSSVQARMNSSKSGDFQYYLGLAYV